MSNIHSLVAESLPSAEVAYRHARISALFAQSGAGHRSARPAFRRARRHGRRGSSSLG